jgi:hypothetical protein
MLRPSIVCGLSLFFSLLAGLGCDPYGNFNDPDQPLGPVDPVLFPPANVGTGGDRKRPGRGRFSEITAYVAGAPVGYFSYPLPTPAAGTDPLRVLEQGQPYEPVPTPAAYVFDGNDGSAFPEEERYPCTPPPDYRYVPQRDAVDYSKQGPVFAKLPEATYTEGALPTTKYVPVVAEAGMVSRGFACQQLKSVSRIRDVAGMLPAPTGKYLAWLIIDPGAPVYTRENPTGGPMDLGIGLQRWGWYNRYLLAFLDGGYLPVEEAMATITTVDGPVMGKVMRMRPQRLFVPRQVRTDMGVSAGRAGAGYDVLEFRRGGPAYSPLCQLWSYGDPAAPLPIAELPTSAEAILARPDLNASAATPASYVFCLQVR